MCLAFIASPSSSRCVRLCCSLSFLLSSLSLSFYAPLCCILFSGAVEILTLCSQTPHPVTILSSLSSTSPLSREVQSWKTPFPSAHTNTQPLDPSAGPCMHDCTADGWQAFWAFIRHCCVCLFSSSPLSSCPLLSLLSHRVRAATSSCNPALQKAVIELEIHARIIAVIRERW